jgi:Mg2+ and Co2+ transporter CorA
VCEHAGTARVVDVLVGRNVLITMHAGPLASEDALQARFGGNGHLACYDSAYLLHVFLDTLLDQYGRVFEGFERRADRLEDRLLREPGRAALGDMLVLKRRVVGFRRLVRTLDEPLTTLVAPDSPLDHRPGVDLGPFHQLNSRHDALVYRLDWLRELTHWVVRSAPVECELAHQPAVQGADVPVGGPAAHEYDRQHLRHEFQVRAFTDATSAWLFYAALGGMALVSVCLLAYFRLRRWL